MKRAVLLILASFSSVAIAQSMFHPMQSDVPLRLPQDGKLFSSQVTPLPEVTAPAAPYVRSNDPEIVQKPTVKEPVARTYRTPAPAELALVPVPAVPSAQPATIEQQEAARVQAWQALEEERLQREHMAQLALEREKQKPQVVIVQQQDPWLSSVLAIPRFIGSLFGR